MGHMFPPDHAKTLSSLYGWGPMSLHPGGRREPDAASSGLTRPSPP